MHSWSRELCYFSMKGHIVNLFGRKADVYLHVGASRRTHTLSSTSQNSAAVTTRNSARACDDMTIIRGDRNYTYGRNRFDDKLDTNTTEYDGCAVV